ncbi:sigma-54 factor interaction domain-containing protein, partial [Xanthomonas sacchari]|uniref:sigma-54 factor interaction domain-containing protein n=1 Tax=Xanthomonas sacchari TaxID=56458 RepID=UPI002259255B
SARAAQPFVATNCAAIPAELMESELFGYRKGAVSGAVSDRNGLIRDADGGTLFLDEIGDMPLPMQAKLLRFLREGEVSPLGGRGAQKVDVRVIAATHR